MKRAAFGVLTCLCVAQAARAQVSATGNLSAYGEVYSRSVGLAARPNQTGRINANLTLSLLNGAIVAPLSALISTDQVSFRQSINRIGISPTYKTLTLHAGWFTPEYSRYTIADATLLGGGVDWAPLGGRLRIGGVYGRARRAVNPDTALNAEAQWARWMAGGRVGYGDPQGTSVDLFVVRTADRAGGLDTLALAGVTPPLEASTTAGLKGQAAFLDRRVVAQVEAARSRYTHDHATPGARAVSALAVTGNLLYNQPGWTVGTTIEYVGTGFASLGNSGLTGDHVDVGLTGNARFEGGRLTIQGMFGWRRNNLQHALSATTTSAIYNIGGTWQPGPTFGIGWQLANNINNNHADNDTSSIRNVTGSYTLTPHVLWRTGAVQHVLVLVGGYQRSENTSPVSVGLIDVATGTAVLNYTAAFPSGLSLVGTVTYTSVNLDTLGTTAITTVAPGVSDVWFNRTLQATVQAQYMHSSDPGGISEGEWFPALQLTYSFPRGQSVTLRTTLRHHTSSIAGAAFDERVATLQYSVALR